MQAHCVYTIRKAWCMQEKLETNISFFGVTINVHYSKDKALFRCLGGHKYEYYMKGLVGNVTPKSDRSMYIILKC